MSKLRDLPDISMEEKYCLGGSQNLGGSTATTGGWWPSSVMEQEMVRGDSDVQYEFLLNFS